MVNRIVTLAGIIIGIGILFAHALFAIRLARPPSGPIAFAAKWCFLGLGSWVFLSAGAVGLSAYLFCRTEIPFFDEFALFLRGFLLLSGVLYLFVLAMLGGRVANRDRGDHQVGMSFGLTVFLWLPLLTIFATLSDSILGQSIIDWPRVPIPCTVLALTTLAALSGS